MRRFTGPGWRIAGAVGSWVLFSFSFLNLYQAAAVVSGLGGFCASGGPYVIETECPESVVVLAPLGIFGMLIAAGIGLVFARGFGTPLLVWAWPILFVGLGIQFGLSALNVGGRGGGVGDAVVSILLALMFVVMGAVPLVFELRGGPRVLRGTHSVFDERFAEWREARRSVYGWAHNDRRQPRDPDQAAEPVTPTAGHWAVSLGLLLVSIAAGAWLSFSAFMALAGG